MTPDPVVSEVIRMLRDAVRARAAALRLDPAWGPVAQPHLRFEFTRFAYGETGIGDYELRQSLVQKDCWTDELLNRAVAGMRPPFEAAVASLSGLHSDPFTVRQAAAHIFGRLMLDELEGKGFPDDERERCAEQLFRSLRGQPVRAWVNADLVGVAVLCPPLDFDSPNGVRVSLRAVEPEELGGDISLDRAEVAERRVKAHPSAFLRLETEAINSSGWQPSLERAVAILTLFGVGGVAWTRAEFGSESLVDIHGGIVLRDEDGGSRRTFAVTDADAARLPRFWETLGAALAPEFYWHPPEDPVGLDAAWFNYRVEVGRSGYVNERIASVVRSLESLFLRDDENHRVTHKLGARAATLLCACGFDPREVRRTISWAYEVRSRYYHGGATLSRRVLGQIESGAGGLLGLLNRCLEYNRAALVTTVLARTDKPGLLRLLEDEETLQDVGAAYRELHGGFGR